MNLDAPHRRFNPLNLSWVQVSPQRTGRPWQGEVSEPDPPPPAHDPACYLCPGNARVGGEANLACPGVRVFDNDFPALLPEATSEGPPPADPLLRAEPSTGVCRAICFSPDHGKSLPLLRSAAMRKFMVGYEMRAEPQRDLTPERAAEMLRSVSGLVHYAA